MLPPRRASSAWWRTGRTTTSTDRCAAGCGRYLGYIADEMNLGVHELGPLACQASRTVRINSTCTVFAGAELRERLALGQKREEIRETLERQEELREDLEKAADDLRRQMDDFERENAGNLETLDKMEMIQDMLQDLKNDETLQAWLEAMQDAIREKVRRFRRCDQQIERHARRQIVDRIDLTPVGGKRDGDVLPAMIGKIARHTDR